MSSTGGYRSPVNLGLGRVPKNTDPEIFDELTEVYNSIHLLAAYMDALRLSLAGGGSGQNPAETMPFTRFFVGPALQQITAGMVVCPASIGGNNGIVRGALASSYSSTSPECNFAGIALSDADIDENVRVGVGPGVFELPGITSGALVWAYSSLSTVATYSEQGSPYATAPPPIAGPNGGTVYPTAIGIGLATGYAMIDQFIRRTP